MAELSPLEKLKIIEENFQNWFRKAYDLKDYTDVDVDLLVRELPNAKRVENEGFDRFFYYDHQFKLTIKIPPQYQATPQLFINALGKYFVDSAKYLYKDQIRYEYYGRQSTSPGDWFRICIYKSCGSDVGCFCAQFQLEGNLVIAQVGYQIFNELMPLCAEPINLATFSSSSLTQSGRRRIFRYAPVMTKTIFERSLYSIGILIIFFWLSCCLPLLLVGEVKRFFEITLFCMIIGFFCLLFFRGFLIAIDSMLDFIFDSKTRRYQQTLAIEYDLSPIHFPVKYFNHDDFNEAFTKSHDHQIFFKQLQEVVNRMSALGESSNS